MSTMKNLRIRGRASANERQSDAVAVRCRLRSRSSLDCPGQGLVYCAYLFGRYDCPEERERRRLFHRHLYRLANESLVPFKDDDVVRHGASRELAQRPALVV